MSRIIEVFKAKRELICVLKGALGRHSVIWFLDSQTALDLHRIYLADPEFEGNQLRSITSKMLTFRVNETRVNLHLYASHRAQIHRIIDGTLNDVYGWQKSPDKDAGEVLRWLHHQNKWSENIEHCGVILNAASLATNRSEYMSLAFKKLHDAGIFDYLVQNPDMTDSVMRLVNEHRGRYPGDISIDGGKLCEMAKAPAVLQEGAL